MPPNPFARLKARYCLIAIAVAWYVQPGAAYVGSYFNGWEWYWWNLVFHYYAHATLAVFIVAAIYLSGLNPAKLFGRAPQRRDIWPILKLDLLLYSADTALIALIFIPVSYVLPGFVSWWLEWVYEPVIFLDAGGGWSLAPNLLSLLSLVVLAPVLEEILFRGFLLHRLARKWGITLGILISSALFGVLHPDGLGAAIFGVAMCLLYMRTRSLYASIIAHGAYNFAVWLFELYGVLDKGMDYYQYDLGQFRGDAWIAAIYALIAVLLIDHYLRRRDLKIPRRLPAG